MASQAAEAAKALDARDYPKAIKLYTQALASSNSPVWLTQRSTAHARCKQLAEALQDAEHAVLEAIHRGRRELIASAQMRRAITLHAMGFIADARLCLTWVRKLNEKEPRIGVWQEVIKRDYEKLPDGDTGKKVILKEIPDEADRNTLIQNWQSRTTADGISNLASTSSDQSQAGMSSLSKQTLPSPAVSTVKAEPSTANNQTAREKIKQEWFQSSSKVTVTFFAKNVPKDKISIHYDSSSLSVSFPTGTPNVDYDFTAAPLYANIVVAESSHITTLNKIEITLHKAKTGLKWPKLESDVVEFKTEPTESTKPSATLTDMVNTTSSKAPAYPTSSRNGPKDWDALAKQALVDAKTKNVNKDASDGKEAEMTTADDDSDDEGDALNGFFKKLYKGADDDTRRAMMKSYVESNGTALSTDWKDVSKKEVPTEAPEGLEAKKW